MKTFLTLFFLSSSLAVAAPIKFASQTVNFAPTNTAEVGRAFLGVRCLRQAYMWEDLVNVAKTLACYEFKVNGVSMGKYKYEKAIEMKKLGPNQFELPKTEMSFATTMKGHACFRVLATLETGVFEKPIDEWSLFTWCTVEKLPFPVDSEIYENGRVKTLNEFKNKLNAPIVIRTKPL